MKVVEEAGAEVTTLRPGDRVCMEPGILFRYAHVYPRALSLMGSGKVKLLPLATETFPFEKSIDAYVYAAKPDPGSVKVQITLS